MLIQSRPFIPYGEHSLDDSDIAAVVDVLHSSRLTQGPAVEAFEEGLAAYVGAKYAVAVTNGTAALHLAVLALDLPPRSLGMTSAISFVASSNCLLYGGHRVAFADVETTNGLMNLDNLEEQLATARAASDPVRVVIPVHYSGQPVDMERLWALKDKYGFHIIEDAAHALGARYPDGGIIGSSDKTAMTMVSFHPVKHIATGEGGVILTNDLELKKRLLRLRSHGITKGDDPYLNGKNAINPRSGKANAWYYEMQTLGFNYRLPDINAALGTSQLRRLKAFVERRRHLADTYRELLAGNPYFRAIDSDVYGKSSYHLFVVQLTKPQLAEHRDELMRSLLAGGVGSQVHYIPIPMQPYYQNLGYETPKGSLAFYQRTLTLPLFPAMRDDDVPFVVQTLNACAKKLLGEL